MGGRILSESPGGWCRYAHMETIIVEAMRMKAIDEAHIMALLTQGMGAFEANENMTKHLG